MQAFLVEPGSLPRNQQPKKFQPWKYVRNRYDDWRPGRSIKVTRFATARSPRFRSITTLPLDHHVSA
jgi:hypothetical protein